MRWGLSIMDVPVFFLLLVLHLVDKSDQLRADYHWEHVAVRYGVWYKLPPFKSRAFQEGYTRKNDICKTDRYHGFLFVKGENTQAMPIYDFNGNLVGIRSAFQIPGNIYGFNSFNQTIDLPPVEIMPPVLDGFHDSKGLLYYTVTAYFRHPKLVCSPIQSAGVSPEKGLYIQMGFNPETYFLKIPVESKDLPSVWKRGTCLPMIGTHYFMNLSKDMPCEKLYPLFLLYNPEGKLGAFGWIFQGRPDKLYSKGEKEEKRWYHIKPAAYPLIFDTKQLPQCMFHRHFQVFGLHVWLQNEKEMLCTVPTPVEKPRKPVTAPSTLTVITVKEPKNNYYESASSKTDSSKLLIHILGIVYILDVILGRLL